MSCFAEISRPPLLLAQSILEREGVQARYGITLFIVVLAAVGIALVVARVIYRERRVLNSPPALFAELCRAHDIDAKGRRLLAELAHSHALPQPTLLFVQPDCFDTERLTADLRPRAPEIEALAGKLFVAAEIQA